MDEYAGDNAIRHRFRRGLVGLGALCATAALMGAVAPALGGPAWLTVVADVFGGVALLFAGGSLQVRP